MKKKLLLIIMMVFVSTGLIVSVKADVGPKPTAEIEIIGFDEDYYFDILYKTSHARVLSQEEIDEEIENDYYRDDFPDVLNGFIDNDGFASYTLYRGIPHHIDKIGNHKFFLGYFSPPKEFKIVLVLDNDEIIVSDIINKRLFNAEITFDLSDFSLEDSEVTTINGVSVYQVNEPSPHEFIPWQQIIIQIILGVILTLIIEIFILYVFKYIKKESYKLTLFVNLVTQFIFHTALIAMSLISAFFGFVLIFIFGELVVLTIEIIVYRRYLKERGKGTATIYAIIANIVSLLLGVFLLGELVNLII